ncbi:hypothetical protein CTI12_AA425050 [Artemisia annua]|uniref:Uncharacterized protein n=1 Tax=Artemisia annua TaxID=35608 RepID=A0A2U1M3C0_ARTAN|nr:hypothetical protein CTI12_AA425050 [Artemisia annua]
MGEIPIATIRKLRKLEVLSLWHNQLHGQLPRDLRMIPTLKDLYLQHNLFTGSTKFSHHIKVFNLSDNRFAGTADIQNLDVLETLDLSNNYFFGNLPFVSSPFLKSINFSTIVSRDNSRSLLEIQSFLFC